MIARADPINSASIGLWLAYILFSIGLTLSIASVNLPMGPVPLRALFIGGALVLVMLTHPALLIDVLMQLKNLLLMIATVAVLGAVVSIANGQALAAILVQLVEIHLQAAIGLVLAFALSKILGPAKIISAFVAIWSLSAIFALLQIMDIGWAWSVRAQIGNWMDDPAITRHFYDDKVRALGLSFTPVHLATQTCLAFAGFAAYRVYSSAGTAIQRWDWPIFLAAILAILVATISGNRSPILGITIFLTIYAFVTTPRTLIIALPALFLAMIALPGILEFLDTAGMRIGQTDDGSAIGRAALFQFGWSLFWDQPLGYGLLFESTDFANQYAHQIGHMDNAEIIRSFSLHNFYLQMLNKYGFAILAVLLWVWPRHPNSWRYWFIFLPYIIHIGFHNDGPLSSDFLIWFLLPAIKIMVDSEAASPVLPKPAAEPRLT